MHDRRLGAALVYACSASAVLGFVPNVGTGCAGAVRSRQGVEGACSSIIGGANTHNHRSFAGTPVLQGRPAAGLRRGGRRGRIGRERRTVQMIGLDDTFFGVGGPEVVVVLAVGYFVLGPVELAKLVKQAGVLIGQLRDVGLGTVSNLTSIVDDQILNAEQIASGEKKPPDYFAPEEEFPMSDEDEFEDVTIDEFGRMVYEGQPEKPPPMSNEDRPPFWEGLGDKISNTISDLDKEEGPLKEASKFAQQLSGAVNEKVLGNERASDPASVADVGAGAAWEGAEAAAGAAAGGAAAGVGMASGWKPPTSEVGMGEEVDLANDVPSELTAESGGTAELSIDEQFERLDTIAALEEERATMMQRLDAKIEAKIGNIKSELLELVDEDFKEKRVKIDQEFAAKAEAKAKAAAAAAAAASAAAAEAKAKEDAEKEGTGSSVTPSAPSTNVPPAERSTAAAGIKMEDQ